MTQQEAEVILKVNEQEAREKFEKLEAKAKELRKQFAEAFKKSDTRAIDEINKKLRQTDKELDNMRTNAANIRAAMVRLNEASPRDLQRTIKLINNELNSGRVKRGTKEWDEYVQKLKEVKAELKNVQSEMAVDNDDSGFFDKIKDGINDWGATAAATMGAFAGVVMSGKAAVQAYADMEAEEANVRKFTGMTADEVARLNDEFKKLDTRTSREDLNKLAQEAGRLGKTSITDVLGFVNAADKLNVALDDLGDGATLTLSKLTGIFGDENLYGTEQSLLKVGSVINELSQNCSASAPYLAEFSSRLGGIAAQSKMSISQVMAFAAVLDTQNLAVEASSTAVGQLITKIYQEPAEIAKASGMDVKKFSDMVKNDMNGALIMLFEHLNQFGGMETLAKVFDDMGTDGARAIPVLAALSGHVEELKWQQEEANKAFQEGVSVTNEFNVQNTTVQAQLDKAKKGFTEMAVSLGQQLLPVMRYCISGTSMLMRVLGVLVTLLKNNLGLILTLTTAVVAYNVAIRMSAIRIVAHNAAMTAGNILMATARGLLLLITAGVSLMSGNVTKASAAWKLFNLAIKANPIGLAVSAIMAGIAALTMWITKNKEAAKEERRIAAERRKQQEEFRKGLTNIGEAAAGYSAKELTRLKKLYDAATNVHKSQKKRIEAANKLQEIYPNTFSSLKTEEILAGKAADAYLRLAQNIREVAKAEAAKDKMKENENTKITLEFNNDEIADEIAEKEKLLDALDKKISGLRTAAGGSTKKARELAAAKEAYRQVSDELSDLDMQRAINNDRIEEATKANIKLQKIASDAITSIENLTPETSTVTPNLPESEKERKEREKKEREARRKAKEALQKDLDERKSAYLQAEAENLTLYVAGEKNYLDYCSSRESLEKEYIDDVVKIHENHNQIDVAAYGAALKQKADLLKKHHDAERKRSAKDLENTRQGDEDAAVKDFYTPDGPLYQNKRALNERLFAIEMEYLRQLAELHLEGSEERAEIEKKIEEREAKNRLEKQKELSEAVERFKAEFGDAGRSAAYRAEIDMLELLHKKGLIKEEGYQKCLEKIRSKYRSANMSESVQSVEDIFSRLVGLAPDRLKELSGKMTEWLSGLSEEERARLSEGFDKGFDNIVGKILENGLAGVESLIEGFNDASEGNWENLIDKLGEMAENAANIIGGIMSTFSSYWSAQRDVELAEIEKRYDREIEAAGKNTKKKEKLEKQKEAEIAKTKKKYNDRAMKMEIAQAIAQTAANALGAYGAMVKIPVVGPALAAAAAAMATAAGAIQIATIKKQHEAQAAGYYEGGFTSRNPDNRKTVGVVHANEFVANHKAVANPALAPVLQLIDHAQRNNTVGSLTASDVSHAIGTRPGVGPGGGFGSDSDGATEAFAESVALMADMTASTRAAIDRLSDNIESGIEAYMVMDGERGFYKKYEHYKRLNNNPKR